VVPDPAPEYCFSFDSKQTVPATQTGDVQIVLDADETTHPRPAYERGLYFDGHDFLNLSGLALNTSFTLQFWVRPESISSGRFLTVPEVSLIFEVFSGAT
jgi:hypothetical protein